MIRKVCQSIWPTWKAKWKDKNWLYHILTFGTFNLKLCDTSSRIRSVMVVGSSY